MTELIWDGKYDKDGKKNGPVRIALPFQTIETVNESAQERQKTLDLFSQGRPTEWRNRLIWGDKKYVLPSLLPEFAGKVDLIYIDPPFDTGADFSFTATIPDNPETFEDETSQFTKRASIIEQKAYRDTWGKGVESYLHWFYETTLILRELLSEKGSIYIHLDYHVIHYAKIILDEIFGFDRFINEIIWKRSTAHSDSKRFGNLHDTILFYSKNVDFAFSTQYEPYSEQYIKTYFRHSDNNGKYLDRDLSAKGLQGGGYNYEWKGKQGIWRCPIETMKEYEREGRIYYTKQGTPRLKQYLNDMPGVPVQDIWTDIVTVNSQAKERIGYSTQKPVKLLERIILTSSNESSLVLDCFVGSGTTAAVAEKLNRRWIACDLGRFAIHTTRKRLLQIPNIKPFVVQNLGKYERQQWMGTEFPNVSERSAVEQRYRNFILQLYQAEPVSGFLWLHGAKAGRMVHVGSVDSPVSVGDVKSIVQEFWKAVGKTPDITRNGVDILGWEFAFEINETAKQYAAANNVDLKFKKIPTEVLEKKAVEQGDIKFYELASLSVETIVEDKKLTIKLTDFIVPPDDIPEEIRRNITHWQQWIDYWAVDFNFRDDTFHNEWQSYRTKKNPKIELTVSHTYPKNGTQLVVVKVIDILGNDTTKLLEAKI